MGRIGADRRISVTKYSSSSSNQCDGFKLKIGTKNKIDSRTFSPSSFLPPLNLPPFV